MPKYTEVLQWNAPGGWREILVSAAIDELERGGASVADAPPDASVAAGNVSSARHLSRGLRQRRPRDDFFTPNLRVRIARFTTPRFDEPVAGGSSVQDTRTAFVLVGQA